MATQLALAISLVADSDEAVRPNATTAAMPDSNCAICNQDANVFQTASAGSTPRRSWSDYVV